LAVIFFLLSNTYRITLEDENAGVIVINEDGEEVEKWTYGITKRTGWSPKAEFLMGLEKDIVVSDTGAVGEFYERYLPCQEDTFGVGDCLRQYLKWNNIKNLAEITFFVKPTGTTSTLPIFVKKGLLVGAGSILGPAAALEIENTFFIDGSGDGHFLAVAIERVDNKKKITAKKCYADPNDPNQTCNYPEDFKGHEQKVSGIELEEAYFCIPERDGFVANTELDEMQMHCGYVEFKDEDSSIAFSNRGRCKKIGGKLYCY